MNKTEALIYRINEYRHRYETESYHPELNNLLKLITIHLLELTTKKEI